MGFLKDQAARLQRETWASPTELAEELYAMFTSEKPVVFDSPVVINNPTGGPGITINQGDAGDTSIEIINNPYWHQGDTTTTITNQFITIIYGDGTIEGYPDPPPAPEDPQPGDGEPVGGGGGGFPCEVVSGSGFLYTCNVYTSGLGTTPIQTQVRFLGMSSQAQLPAGTQSVANLVGASYFSYVACWI